MTLTATDTRTALKQGLASCSSMKWKSARREREELDCYFREDDGYDFWD